MEWVRLKKGQQSIGKSRGGWTTKIHSVVADAKLPIKRRLSPGSAASDPVAQKLMAENPKGTRKGKSLLMDKTYEGDECRKKTKKCGVRPMVPPKSNRKEPWKYNKNCTSVETSWNVTSGLSKSSEEFTLVMINSTKHITHS